MAGRFIVLEGGEGVGKSTNREWLRQRLGAAGIEVTCSREPGGTAFGERLRDLLLDAGRGDGILPETELLLMFAARKQHLQEVIRPALAAGRWVVCDRFTDASYAYQGGGRGLDFEHIAYLERWLQDGVYPDMTLLFDAPVDTGLARAAHRGEADRFEREQAAFFQRVRRAYRQRAEQAPARYRLIDASQPLAQVQAQLETAVSEMLAEWGPDAV